MSNNYMLTVVIPDSLRKGLIEAGYSLCLARKVGNNDFNVIWQGNKQYLKNNDFEWSQEYQVFASKAFKDGALVKAVSDPQDIEYKQVCIFDNYGTMNPATADKNGKEGSFKVENQYQTLNFAVSTKVNGLYRTIYVTPSAITGSVAFEPKNEVRVWFALHTETSTMISDIMGKYIDIPYGKLVSRSVEYQEDGSWHIIA
ncbi:hypothetical protein D9757_009254 [Collybiopsis confluens]|uniref:Uncharacterized protein n=1 Tax=Collybiopsis confluens TaxID=2823264 RepID=A0A8H5H9S2_9AGAR|nr:hypothetical protein D9757_009254 [Collybiopsis confluens]